MSSNIYTTGLRNDGSYKVSGQPFIVRKVINVGQEVKVEFPYDTKNVTVRIPTPPNVGLQVDPIQFGDLPSGRWMTSDPGPTPGVYDLGGAGKDFTISFWYIEVQSWLSNGRLMHITKGNGRVADWRMKSAGPPLDKYQWNSNAP